MPPGSPYEDRFFDDPYEDPYYFEPPPHPRDSVPMRGPMAPRERDPRGPFADEAEPEDDEAWGPLPPRSRKPAATLAAVVVISGLSGFGTIAFIAGNTEHVTSADGPGTTVAVTTTTTTTEPEPVEEEEAEEEPEEEAVDEPPESEEPDEAPPPPSDSGPSGPGPEETVRMFFDAMGRGDCETAVDLLAEESWGSLSREERIAQCQAESGDTLNVTNVRLTNQDGNAAEVEVTISEGGQSMSVPMVVMVEDGRWKLVAF